MTHPVLHAVRPSLARQGPAHGLASAGATIGIGLCMVILCGCLGKAGSWGMLYARPFLSWGPAETPRGRCFALPNGPWGGGPGIAQCRAGADAHCGGRRSLMWRRATAPWARAQPLSFCPCALWGGCRCAPARSQRRARGALHPQPAGNRPQGGRSGVHAVFRFSASPVGAHFWPAAAGTRRGGCVANRRSQELCWMEHAGMRAASL